MLSLKVLQQKKKQKNILIKDKNRSKNKKHQYKISAFSTTIHTNDDKYESNISNNYENYLNSFINK